MPFHSVEKYIVITLYNVQVPKQYIEQYPVHPSVLTFGTLGQCFFSCFLLPLAEARLAPQCSLQNNRGFSKVVLFYLC